MAEYHVENFGCRASQADGAGISVDLQQLGLKAARDLRSADVVVLNTCSVTEEADRQARAFIRKARRTQPQVRVLVTGCYAQRAPEEIAALPGVDRVIGNSHKALVGQVAASLVGVPVPPGKSRQPDPDDAAIVTLEALLRSGSPLADETFAHAELSLLEPSGSAGTLSAFGNLTRPNLKVQDGCGNRCSFCVIPQTRGGSRSIHPEKVLAGVRRFVTSGGQELVLSGINLGRWGRDFAADQTAPADPARIEELIETILTQTELPRLRISSIEPMDWSDRLIQLFTVFARGDHPRLARHAHLPLQSGSDTVLRAMHRRYRPWHYEEKLEAIHAAVPDAALGADVMVGFPGETAAHFEETYALIERLPFTYLHLFPFSARPGTPAWALHKEKQVHGEAARERMVRLRLLGEVKNRCFRERQVGRKLSVITLHGRQTHDEAAADRSRDSSLPVATHAISDNFVTVEVAGSWPANQLLHVTVDGSSASGLTAHA